MTPPRFAAHVGKVPAIPLVGPAEEGGSRLRRCEDGYGDDPERHLVAAQEVLPGVLRFLPVGPPADRNQQQQVGDDDGPVD